MSNPVAVIGLTYGGTDVQEAGYGIFLELVRGLEELPKVRGENTLVPNVAGRIAGARVKDTLAIELEGIVTGAAGTALSELTSFRAKATAFGTLFDPTITRALVATLEDASVQTIQARTLTHTWDQLNPMVARVNVALESISPDWS